MTKATGYKDKAMAQVAKINSLRGQVTAGMPLLHERVEGLLTLTKAMIANADTDSIDVSLLSATTNWYLSESVTTGKGKDGVSISGDQWRKLAIVACNEQIVAIDTLSAYYKVNNDEVDSRITSRFSRPSGASGVNSIIKQAEKVSSRAVEYIRANPPAMNQPFFDYLESVPEQFFDGMSLYLASAGYKIVKIDNTRVIVAA